MTPDCRLNWHEQFPPLGPPLPATCGFDVEALIAAVGWADAAARMARLSCLSIGDIDGLDAPDYAWLIAQPDRFVRIWEDDDLPF